MRLFVSNETAQGGDVQMRARQWRVVGRLLSTNATGIAFNLNIVRRLEGRDDGEMVRLYLDRPWMDEIARLDEALVHDDLE